MSDTVYRLVGTVAFILVGWQIGTIFGADASQPRNAILGIAIGAVLGFLLAPFVVARPYHALRRLVGRMPPGDLLSALLGLLIGLAVGALVSYPLSFLPWSFGHILPAAAAVICAYLGMTLMMMRRRELMNFFRAGSGVREAEAAVPPSEFLVDTSAIIDGRIADVAATGFIRSTLVVPQFVLRELQSIADSGDSMRRARGRRGLDVLSRLQKESHVSVDISDIDARDVRDVDGKLLQLARQSGRPVLTNDFNLNRVAELQGVTVLNINQLANSLKPVVLPGEEMAVRIIQEGKESHQGVGYLDDGTMIVVENGRRYLNNDVDVVVTRVLQTVAGKMIFAQPKSNGR